MCFNVEKNIYPLLQLSVGDLRMLVRLDMLPRKSICCPRGIEIWDWHSPESIRRGHGLIGRQFCGLMSQGFTMFQVMDQPSSGGAIGCSFEMIVWCQLSNFVEGGSWCGAPCHIAGLRSPRELLVCRWIHWYSWQKCCAIGPLLGLWR
jgi:hypothetical protein